MRKTSLMMLALVNHYSLIKKKKPERIKVPIKKKVPDSFQGPL